MIRIEQENVYFDRKFKHRMMNRKAALVILDGWGLGNDPHSDAIQQANTPFIDHLYQTHPHSKLITYGDLVGLPDGQMGNSEVGHLNIGAGRTVYQDLLKINRAIDTGDIYQENILIKLGEYCLTRKKSLHLLGLLSDGGVHSHIDHIIAMAKHFDALGVQVIIHAFLDGRDTDPQGGVEHLKYLFQSLSQTKVIIASICGRYYAMDRDQRWERTKKAYDLLVHKKGKQVINLVNAVEESYDTGVYDEFIEPVFIEDMPVIKEDDAVFFVNFRSDRPRQLTDVLSQKAFPEYNMSPLDLYFVTMTDYDRSFQNIQIVYPKKYIKDTLGETISRSGRTQLRAAETEKYPHVTYFFNGGREEALDGERRILIPSPKVATYDMKPEMSARQLTQAVRTAINEHQPDLLVMNYANADMVGHAGDFAAAQQACEAVDKCLSELVQDLTQQEYSILIIADHGNADMMINDDGSPNTSHTTNPVPCILIDPRFSSIKDGNLTDIAPTILSIMGMESPSEMTGQILCDA